MEKNDSKKIIYCLKMYSKKNSVRSLLLTALQHFAADKESVGPYFSSTKRPQKTLSYSTNIQNLLSYPISMQTLSAFCLIIAAVRAGEPSAAPTPEVEVITEYEDNRIIDRKVFAWLSFLIIIPVIGLCVYFYTCRKSREEGRRNLLQERETLSSSDPHIGVDNVKV